MPNREEVHELVSAVFQRERVSNPTPISDARPAPGSSFELELLDQLNILARRYHGVPFHNLYVPYRDGNEFAQVDCVLLLPDRLVVVECKDCQGTVYCQNVLADNEKPYWKQELPGHRICWIYSPLEQNMSHMSALSSYTGVSYQKCFCLVVFSNRATLEDLPSTTEFRAVVTLRELKKMQFHIVSSRAFPQPRFNSIVSMLDRCTRPSPSVVEQHMKYAHNQDTKRPAGLPPVVCPLCGAPLQLRQGTTKFLGCSMYPLCSYTCELKE